MEKTKVSQESTVRRGEISLTRQRIIGGLFILAAIFVYFVLAKPTAIDTKTTFGTNINDRAIQIPDWVFNSKISLEIIAGLCLGLGVFQITRSSLRKLGQVNQGHLADDGIFQDLHLYRGCFNIRPAQPVFPAHHKFPIPPFNQEDHFCADLTFYRRDDLFPRAVGGTLAVDGYNPVTLQDPGLFRRRTLNGSHHGQLVPVKIQIYTNPAEGALRLTA